MLSFLLRCFHFSYYVAALSPMLLLLHQYCCSSFNIAAPPSMLPLHLDVASPPLILTLQRVSEMRMVICRKEQSSWWSPPLMLPLFLWWIDVSANSQYYCSSVVVAAFPVMLQCPCKNELFSIAGPSNWSLHKGLAIPWSPPRCYPSSSDVAAPSFMFLFLLLCCSSSFYVATSPWCCHSSIDIAILSLMFLLLIYVTAPPLRLPLHLQCPWKYESRIQYLGSKIRGLGSRIQDDQSMSCILLI